MLPNNNHEISKWLRYLQSTIGFALERSPPTSMCVLKPPGKQQISPDISSSDRFPLKPTRENKTYLNKRKPNHMGRSINPKGNTLPTDMFRAATNAEAVKPCEVQETTGASFLGDPPKMVVFLLVPLKTNKSGTLKKGRATQSSLQATKWPSQVSEVRRFKEKTLPGR